VHLHRMRDSSANVRAPKVNGTSYKVEFKTISKSFPRVKSGPTPAVTELQVVSCGLNSGTTASVWRYRTGSLNSGSVGAVEWIVTATDHAATICDTTSAVVSVRNASGAPQVLVKQGTISQSSSCANPLAPFSASVTVLYKTASP